MSVVIKSQLYHQLLDAGLWEEATSRREQIRNELRQSGMTRREASQEAWERLAEEYRQVLEPQSSAVPGLAQEPVEGAGGDAGDFPDDDGSYLDVLDWVLEALSMEDEGIRIPRSSCPGPKSWAIFSWARVNRRTRGDFIALWTSANKRAAESDAEGDKAESLKQQAELIAMLEELGCVVPAAG